MMEEDDSALLNVLKIAFHIVEELLCLREHPRKWVVAALIETGAAVSAAATAAAIGAAARQKYRRPTGFYASK